MKKRGKNPTNRINSKTVYIEGIPCNLKPRDINKDGNVGGIEVLQRQDNRMIGVNTDSEIKDTIKEMNKMESDPVWGISEITKMARIDNEIEENNIVKLQALCRLKAFPMEASIVYLTKLATSISRRGLGRGETVAVSTGIKDSKGGHDKKLVDYAKGLLKRKSKKEGEKIGA